MSCQTRSLRSKAVLCHYPVCLWTQLSLLWPICLSVPSLFRLLEESVCKPFCLIFRNLVTMQEDNSGFSVLLDMLAELYQKQPKIGYHLLYYLKARWPGSNVKADKRLSCSLSNEIRWCKCVNVESIFIFMPTVKQQMGKWCSTSRLLRRQLSVTCTLVWWWIWRLVKRMMFDYSATSHPPFTLRYKQRDRLMYSSPTSFYPSLKPQNNI